eukprot:SAG31_NODE_58_length_29669_cov_20.244978_10_plen_95_part_00
MTETTATSAAVRLFEHGPLQPTASAASDASRDSIEVSLGPAPTAGDVEMTAAERAAERAAAKYLCVDFLGGLAGFLIFLLLFYLFGNLMNELRH